MKKSLLICFTILLIIGCKTNPPNSIAEKTGKINVTSNESGANISIDDIDTKLVTPSVIETSIGFHTVKLQKEGFIDKEETIEVVADQTVNINIKLEKESLNKIVLLEDFANVSCNPCVISNKILHSLSEQYKGKIAIIKFPVNFPSPTDPFYLHAKKYSDFRSSYYKIFAAPTVIVDGQTKPISTDSISIKNTIDQMLEKPSQFEITAAKKTENNQIKITIDINSNSNVNTENLLIHTVILEEKIEFAQAPGSNGETVFYDVMRKMLPDENGSGVNLQEGKQKLEFAENIHSVWNQDRLKVIVFIQDKITKEVFQVGISN